jgi:hypothetical protein
MTLENQVVNKELAEKMKELGFDQYSYFVWVKNYDRWEVSRENLTTEEWYPAFTVAELGEMLPWDITIHRDINLGWHIVFQANGLTEKDMLFSEDMSEANARAKMLIYLAEQKLIDPKQIKI